MKKQNKIIAVILILTTLVLSEDLTKVGTTSANFLLMEVGARAIGMGGAYVGLADDASALHWNPAGINFAKKNQLYYEINSMYVGMKHHFAGMTFNINKNNTIGIMANYLNIGEMEVTTIENPEGTGEMFGASSYAIGMSYGNQLTDRVYVGIQGKFIKEKIWLESATGFAVDIGTIYNIEEIGLRIGMALQNLGVDMSVDDGPHLYFYKEKPDDYQGSPQPKSRLATKSFPMPLTFSIGTSVNIVGENAIMKSSGKNRITVSVSANDGFDNAFRTNWGMEYSWREFFALRSGYRQNYDTAGLSLGFGLNTESFTNFNLQIDYAWVDYGDLGPIDLWSIEFKF